jgi:hypothetical protein
LRKGFHGHIPHRTSTLGIIFCGVIWRTGCVTKIRPQFRKLKLLFSQRLMPYLRTLWPRF